MSGFIMADLEEQIQQLETSEEAVVEAPVETAEEETQAPENLAELEQKRNAINDDAEKHRRLRDDLNKQTKEWVAKRDALNAQVRELVEEAGKHRTQRDELNQKVRESMTSKKQVRPSER